MGSEESKEFQDNSLLSINDASLENEGVKTSKESSLEELDYLKGIEIPKFLTGKNLISKDTKLSSDKIPVTFEWNEGGNSVYVTGDFCNWKHDFLMQKISSNLYSLTLNLPKGLIQYKFKVGNEWKYNDKFPTMIDSKGYKNNYIDTTNWEISAESTQSQEENNNNLNTDSESFVKSKHNKSFNVQNNYGNVVPNLNEMNEIPEKIPPSYKHKINSNGIVSKQSRIGNNSFLYQDKDDLFGDNYSYKKVKNIRKEEIDHFEYKLKKINDKPIICSMACRFRLKITNFIYYK